MEREGCVASTQAAAFLQTAVAPQPHKQPHICGNKVAPTSTLFSLNLVGREVFSASKLFRTLPALVFSEEVRK